MKAKVLIIASLLLAGCQASKQPEQYGQSLSSASQGEAGKHAYSRSSSGQWLNGEGSNAYQQDLWQFISDELKMDIPDNHRVKEQKRQYLSKKSYLHDVTDRAEPYMYWIVEQIKKRDMPMELVLLPIVESAFNPQAKSSANAVGIWQIVPQTGRNYGLKQNQWYDGRKDVAASTTAALDILQKLNRMFDGDWLLTLAAYNSGEGRVMQAIKHNKAKGLPTDYWSLSLPRETANYVPKMLALSDIIKNNQRYNLELPKANKERALARVEVGQQIELSQAADMAGMSLTKLKQFNSGYIRNVTAPNGPHYIMLPKSHVKQLKNSLAGSEPTQAIAKVENNSRAAGYSDSDSTQSYQVRTGDSVSSVAKRLNVSPEELKSWNNLGSDKKLKAGQKLQVAKNTNSGKNKSNASITYRVRKGDSLYSIAKRHGVEINDVMRWNRVVAKTNRIQPGDTLTLYIAAPDLPGS